MSDLSNEIGIEQDEKKGPGWFLILSYIGITIFCVYYFFAYYNWKSSYEIEHEKIMKQIEKK